MSVHVRRNTQRARIDAVTVTECGAVTQSDAIEASLQYESQCIQKYRTNERLVVSRSPHE